MAYLFIKEGELSGTKFFLYENSVTIGRNFTNKLFINDLSVSRQHAEIRKNNDKYEIVDLGSANGTFINGERLIINIPRQLYNKDEIIIGNNVLVFYVEESKEEYSKGKLVRDKTKVSVVVTEEEHHSVVSTSIDASKALLYDTTTKTPEKLLPIVKRLQSMIDISIELVTIFQPEELADRIMAHIFDVFPKADRAFIVVWDRKKTELKPLAARSRREIDDKGYSFPVSKTILNTVIEKRQSIMLSDAMSDSRFSAQKSIVNFSIRSLMCAPFICKGEILGVIGVDTMTRQNAFTEEDLLMLTGIASQAAIALKNAELYSALEKETQIRTQLSRYLPFDIVDGIIKGNISLTLGGEKKYGTVIFCDIVGFTTLAENLSAIEVVEKLNRYYSIVTDIVTKYNGTLHKFGGDMIMAFWNVMVPDKEASANAVKCSIEMQNEVFLFNIALEYASQRPIYLGIGCNTGEFAGGNIGGTNRMEYTIIGDNVNLAERIESLASRWQILVSESTYESIINQCAAVKLLPATVKGRTSPIAVYSIRGMELKDNTVILSLPLVIMTPDGIICGNGFASLYNKDLSELHLIISSSLPSWDSLIIQFDIPEFILAPRLIGKVKASYRKYYYNVPYTYVILSELNGDEVGLLLLNPPFIFESKKNWAEMKRH